jgi:hypothetical protein
MREVDPALILPPVSSAPCMLQTLYRSNFSHCGFRFDHEFDLIKMEISLMYVHIVHVHLFIIAHSRWEVEAINSRYNLIEQVPQII